MNAEPAKLVPVSAGLEAATLSLDGLFADLGGLSGTRRHVQTFFRSFGCNHPVVFEGTHNSRMHYAVDITSGGHNSAIIRNMSANKFLGMTDPDIWNATQRP
jgi:hypothetical protein